jgi:hypothetical protein
MIWWWPLRDPSLIRFKTENACEWLGYHWLISSIHVIARYNLENNCSAECWWCESSSKSVSTVIKIGPHNVEFQAPMHKPEIIVWTLTFRDYAKCISNTILSAEIIIEVGIVGYVLARTLYVRSSSVWPGVSPLEHRPSLPILDGTAYRPGRHALLTANGAHPLCIPSAFTIDNWLLRSREQLFDSSQSAQRGAPIGHPPNFTGKPLWPFQRQRLSANWWLHGRNSTVKAYINLCNLYRSWYAVVDTVVKWV